LACHTHARPLESVAACRCQYHFPTIFANPAQHIPYLESRWLLSLRRLLATIQGQLVLNKSFIAPLQRENDEYIMT
jgi:hypothetical protein